MTIAQITAAIEEGIKVESQEYFANTTERNEIVIEAQRHGLEFAITLVDDLAA